MGNLWKWVLGVAQPPVPTWVGVRQKVVALAVVRASPARQNTGKGRGYSLCC